MFLLCLRFACVRPPALDTFSNCPNSSPPLHLSLSLLVMKKGWSTKDTRWPIFHSRKFTFQFCVFFFSEKSFPFRGKFFSSSTMGLGGGGKRKEKKSETKSSALTDRPLNIAVNIASIRTHHMKHGKQRNENNSRSENTFLGRGRRRKRGE